MLGVLPFFHIYGLVVIMNHGLHVGATIVTMPRFELEPFLEVCRTGVTFAYLVPPMVLALAKHPAVDEVRPLAPAHALLRRRPARRSVAAACRGAPGLLVMQGYGLTETSPATHVGPAEPDRIKPGADRAADAEHRVQGRGRRERRGARARASRARSACAGRRS